MIITCSYHNLTLKNYSLTLMNYFGGVLILSGSQRNNYCNNMPLHKAYLNTYILNLMY